MKAQSGLEFLLVFMLTLGVVVILILTAQEHIVGIGGMKDENDAQNSVEDLSSAAKEVYAQGEGAKKQVYIDLPSSYEPTESFVGDNAIKLRAKGSDYVAIQDFDVHGTLPGTSGTHWVWVVSEGNKVRIGPAMITLDPNSIYLIMNRNSSARTFFDVESLWDDSVAVTSDVRWNNPDVTMTVSDTAFVLGSGAKQTVELDFTAVIDGAGFYTGVIAYTATDGTLDEKVKIPVTVEVMSFSMAPPLTVIPSLWNETMLAGDVSKKMFTVCTNEDTSVTGVTFTPTLGPPGSWVEGDTPMGPMAPATCVNKVMNLTVPNGTIGGIYGAHIDVIGQGHPNAKDVITIEIGVGGNITDNKGPLITYFEHMPNKSYDFEPITFIIIANDTTVGNSTIKSCEMSPDYMEWLEMSPVDGTSDSQVEYYEIEYLSGFPIGDHTLVFRCTDIRNNVGEEQNYSIKIMKNFLFASKTNNPRSHELDWMSWVENHLSTEGNNWHFDTTDEDHIINGLVDLEYYSVIAVADYQFSSNVPQFFHDYVSQGGMMVMLGQALQQGPRDQGLTSGTGTTGSSVDMYIMDGDHYITSEYNDGDTVIIYAGNGGSKAVSMDFAGTGIASVTSAQSKYMIAESEGYVLWGPIRTSALNDDGDEISAKVLDYALAESSIRPD
jgi:hypothetical protein